MSALSETLTIKQPIRRLEIQINNFNVAIPHHVDLLKQHKNNIKKVSSYKFLYLSHISKIFHKNNLDFCSIKISTIGNE